MAAARKEVARLINVLLRIQIRIGRQGVPGMTEKDTPVGFF
jgi:hypothetical protein